MKKMQAMKHLFCLLGLAALCTVSLAADNAATGRVLRCTFKAVPPAFRGIAVFDALAIGHDGSLFMGTSTYGIPAKLIRYNRSNEQDCMTAILSAELPAL